MSSFLHTCFLQCTSFYHILLVFQMLRNCKVARVLPRIADSAKNDRNSILRARYEFESPYLLKGLCACIISFTIISSFALGVVNMHYWY